MNDYDHVALKFFTEENFLDFKNFTNPFQPITKIIESVILFSRWDDISFDWIDEAAYLGPIRRGKKITLQANEAELSDSPLQNPWDGSPDGEHEYLTIGSVQELSYNNMYGLNFEIQMNLDDKKILRGRSVYDIITLVSEVSGLADIFFVSITFVIGVLYTPFLLEAALHEHMGPCVAKKNKKKKKVSTEQQSMFDLLQEVTTRFSLKLSIWVVIASKLLPERWRSIKIQHLFELIDKNQQRMDSALDIRN
jgi:hypothetical protein